MRVLHTADWHLGQVLRGYSRIAEQQAVLEELVGLVAERQPDVMVVAGDVFDRTNPPTEALELYYRTLVELHRAAARMQMVVTAGNHDAAMRLEAPAGLLELARVKVVGNVRRVGGVVDASRHWVDVRGARSEMLGRVMAVSFPTAACLSGEVGDRVGSLYRELAAAGPGDGLPFVVTGHLHVRGGQASEGAERDLLIGGADAVGVEVFPEEATYVALGHLHRPQRIGGGRVRYSGSLLPLSASEIGYTHGVVMVEVAAGGVEAEVVSLRRPVAMHRVPERGAVAMKDLRRALEALGAATGSYVYVELKRAGLLATFREDVEEEAQRCGLRLLEVKVESLAPTETRALPELRSVKAFAPNELFSMAFEREHGRAPGVEHARVFAEAME
jgi:exonuclease SbcD